MIRTIWLILALSVCPLLRAGDAAPAKDDDAPIRRAGKPSVRGLELFSWQVKGDETWHFALLPAPGDDKLKPADVASSKETALDGAAALKKKFAELAIGEKVDWFNMIDKKHPPPAEVVFDYPPKEIIRDLELYCSMLKIKLNIYHSTKKP